MFRFKLRAICLFAALLTGPLFAGDPVEEVIQGSSREIENYCSQVTLGEGRIHNCLSSARESLSEGCTKALQEVEE